MLRCAGNWPFLSQFTRTLSFSECYVLGVFQTHSAIRMILIDLSRDGDFTGNEIHVSDHLASWLAAFNAVSPWRADKIFLSHSTSSSCNTPGRGTIPSIPSQLHKRQSSWRARVNLPTRALFSILLTLSTASAPDPYFNTTGLEPATPSGWPSNFWATHRLFLKFSRDSSFRSWYSVDLSRRD